VGISQVPLKTAPRQIVSRGVRIVPVTWLVSSSSTQRFAVMFPRT
jgi:hypothetical protein